MSIIPAAAWVGLPNGSPRNSRRIRRSPWRRSAGPCPGGLFEGLPGPAAERVDDGRGDFLRVVERGGREDLVEVGAVGLACFLGELVPNVLVEFGEVGLVLGVGHVDGATPADDDVRDEVAEGAVDRVGSVD